MDYASRLTDVADEATRRAIVEPLVAFNNAKTGRADHRPLVLTLHDSADQIVGGAT